jgi:hypothetical protein
VPVVGGDGGDNLCNRGDSGDKWSVVTVVSGDSG